MENAPQNFYDLAQQMLLNGHRKEQILDELQRKGAKQDVLEKITEHIIKHKSGKRLSNGFAALIIGALFLLSSFFLTLFASYSGSFGIGTVSPKLIASAFLFTSANVTLARCDERIWSSSLKNS